MGLLRSTAVVSAMTMISRVLGFVRDMVIARLFGATMGADAFFVAFKIPNFLRRLFAEGAFSQAFVPVFSEYKSQRDHAQVKRLADEVTGTLGALLFGVTLIGVIAAPLLIMLFAPGFLAEPHKYDLTVEMLRITFPYLLFISLTALAGGILNIYGQFWVSAFTPVFLNLAMIATMIWMAPYLDDPVVSLAWGVFIAGVLQLVFQFPFLRRLKLLPRPRWGWRQEGVRRIMKLMLPSLFGSSVAQISLLVDTIIASFLVTGSVSWLYYSDRLVEFPLGVFGIALATVILPSLSQQHAQASKEGFAHTLDWGLRWVMLVGTPAMTGLLVLAGPMLITLFQYGAYGPHDVEMSSRSMMAYALGLLAFMLIKVLAPGFYARQDTRTPVRIGLIALGAGMAMKAALVFPLAHAGLALSSSLAAFLNAWLLYRALCREAVYRPELGWGWLMLKLAFANGAMAAVLWQGARDWSQWMAWHGMERVMHLTLWIALGAAVYFACLWIMGVRYRDFRQKAK